MCAPKPGCWRSVPGSAPYQAHGTGQVFRPLRAFTVSLAKLGMETAPLRLPGLLHGLRRIHHMLGTVPGKDRADICLVYSAGHTVWVEFINKRTSCLAFPLPNIFSHLFSPHEKIPSHPLLCFGSLVYHHWSMKSSLISLLLSPITIPIRFIPTRTHHNMSNMWLCVCLCVSVKGIQIYLYRSITFIP